MNSKKVIKEIGRGILSLVFIFSILLSTGCGNASKPPETDSENNNIKPPETTSEDNNAKQPEVDFESDYFSQGEIADEIFVIDIKDLADAEIILLESLQGIVAKTKASIYLQTENVSKFWIEEIAKNYGTSLVYINDVWELVDKFKSSINDNGFIKYSLVNESSNAATTLSGLNNYVMIHSSLVSKAEENGLVQKIDSTDKEVYENVLQNNKSSINDKFAFYQNYKLLPLRDFGIMTNSYFTYQSNAEQFFDLLVPNGSMIGWWRDEVMGVKEASSHMIQTIAADHAYNLSLFSNLPREQMNPKEIQPVSKEEEDVHYVTFIMSDGDNVQWYVNGASFEGGKYGHGARGTIPFGWTVPTALHDMAPNILKYTYDSGTENDSFVAGVSGFGYIHPSEYVKAGRVEELKQFTNLTAKYMDKTGLEYTAILDEFANVPSDEVLDAYLAEDTIKGAFYYTGDRYVAGKGSIYWKNEKPFVSVRETLWSTNKDRAHEDIYEMAYRISSYDKNPKSIDGYTVVNVHAWSHDFKSVLKLTEWLQENDPKVVVVTPEELMDLIVKNVPQENASPAKSWNDSYSYPTFPEKDPFDYIDSSYIENITASNQTEFTFAENAEGFVGGIDGKQYDKALWTDLNEGSLFLDGSDLGMPDSGTNSWFFNKLLIPENAANLEITFYAGDKNSNGGQYRVLVTDNKGLNPKVLIDWQSIKGKTKVDIIETLDISAYAGEEIAVYIEQNDSGNGEGEYVYIKDVKITAKN